VASAKKLGCGAVFMLHPMEDRGVLDSTWGGTLSDMVRFVREMEIVRAERLIEQVPARAARLKAGLAALAARFPELLGNVRGMGLYLGFTMRRPGDRDRLLETALQDESTLLLGAGTDSVRLRPALGVTEEDCDRLIGVLERCLERLGRAS
jgi:L-lysine 6-transaminase